MNMTITNKDAKIIYSKYWYKNMSVEIFPTIYIDEYWEYTIDLFNLREDWEMFLKEFNNEFDSAKQYIEESNRVTNILFEKLFVPDASKKIREFKFKEPNFKRVMIYDRPEGEYWFIDLHSAFNQCLKHIGVWKPDVTYEEVLNESTKSELLKKSKELRFYLYNMFDIDGKNILYNVCDYLLYTLLNKPELKKINVNDVYGICGDCIFIPKDKLELEEGDYVVDDISFHIGSFTVKSIKYKDEIIKYVDNNIPTLFYKNSNTHLSIDEYPCIMKCIKKQQPNQIDLTVGFEEEIFYIMD